MPKNKIGQIEKIGVDTDGLEIFRVRVETGSRDKRSAKMITVRGTMRDAQAAASMLYVELRSSASNREIPEITLNQYFYGRFIPILEKENKTNSTIDGYVKISDLDYCNAVWKEIIDDKYSVVGFPALIPGMKPPFFLIVADTSAGLNVA